MSNHWHDFAKVLQAILEQYQLSLFGDHELHHWARVWTNGHFVVSRTSKREQSCQ